MSFRIDVIAMDVLLPFDFTDPPGNLFRKAFGRESRRLEQLVVLDAAGSQISDENDRIPFHCSTTFHGVPGASNASESVASVRASAAEMLFPACASSSLR